MKLTSSAAFLALPLITCHAATIVLPLVETGTSQFPRASETFKPIGVGADGMTTYFNEIIASVYYEQQLNGGGTTFTSGGSTITQGAPIRTYTSEPVTLQGTLVADASHLLYHHDPNPTATRPEELGGNKLSCAFDGRGGGACVEEHWQKGEPTGTTTYTGSAVPYYTLTVADGSGGGGKGNNGALSEMGSAAGAGAVAVGVLFGFFQVL
ncbi:hypothetical protein FPV67DRAFT_739004 [Lyophyllum atratum]|nr:hypothetical protein FPV67DRAFT_739004 [Lyophyllum atratum]